MIAIKPKVVDETRDEKRPAFEHLEPRLLMSASLVEANDLGYPLIGYDATGTTDYDVTTGVVTSSATPISYQESDTQFGFWLFSQTPTIDFAVEVDSSGNLIGGVSGDDLIITGDLDRDFDFVSDASGVLLTGEIKDFAAVDQGAIDETTYIFEVTGGALAPLFEGSDIAIVNNIEYTAGDVQFTGDWGTDWNGGAKGTLGAIEIEPTIEFAALGDRLWNDLDQDGIQDDGEPGIGGVAVTLLADLDNDSLIDDVVATAVTADGTGADPAGFYFFNDLEPGVAYQVQFGLPTGFAFTSQAAGADTALDSDVDATGLTGVVVLSPNEVNPDIDAGVFQLNPSIDIEKLTDGVDADTPDQAASVGVGDTVTWTYLVTNTGNVAFDEAEVSVVDDNGTPGDTSDDFSPTLVASSDVGGDGVLSAGETWTYEATGVGQDLTTVGAPITVDFEGLTAGTIVSNQLPGITIFGDGKKTSGNAAMIFDSSNPTGGDSDLITPGYGINNTEPLGNVLILSEDLDASDPDDDAKGGTFTFSFDAPVTIDSISMLDIDDNEPGGTVIAVIDMFGGVQFFDIPAVGDNSHQTIDINVDSVVEMQVSIVSSGAITEIVYRETIEGVYQNAATVTAPGASDSDSSSYVNPVLGVIQGTVWIDSDADGEIDFNESAVEGVTVNLTGVDEAGNAVSLTTTTDADGIYAFSGVRAGTYQVQQVQPADLLDGADYVGTVNNTPSGSAGNDVISSINLTAGAVAEDYNFSEQRDQSQAGEVEHGDAATIGFWKGKQGKKLVHALNGGKHATELGNWLAGVLPNMYDDLAGKTNYEIHRFYKKELFNQKRKDALPGPRKFDAQVFAVALATYVTDVNLAGTTAEAWGFNVTDGGVGIKTFNVGGSGEAFGVANGTDMTVMAMLLYTNSMSNDGVLYDADDSDDIDAHERQLRLLANDVYTAINEAGSGDR